MWRRWAALGVLASLTSLLACLSGCGSVVAQAPFRVRPDSTHWGSLLGPFDGQVVDLASGNPVSAALVIGTWSFENESGPAVPVAAYSLNVLTGSDGSYHLPALPLGQQRLALLRRFSLVIYKASYIGYRSDVRWDDRTPRADFAQLANKVRLERLPAGESRAHHLAFLGGGQVLLRVAQAEVIQASLELGERSPGLPTPKSELGVKPPLPTLPPPPPTVAPLVSELAAQLAAQLLTAADIEALLHGQPAAYRGEALAFNLTDANDPVVAEYSGIHYRAKDRPESQDAALRVYRNASGKQAEAVWNRLRSQFQTSQLKDGGGATPTAIPLPGQRSTTPPLPEVPLTAPPLRDPRGIPHPLLPHAPPPASAPPPPPLHLDNSISAYDGQNRSYGVVVLVRQLGLVLELLCGADLCPGDEAAKALLGRALGRL
jgi:hypothetical protein